MGTCIHWAPSRRKGQLCNLESGTVYKIVLKVGVSFPLCPSGSYAYSLPSMRVAMFCFGFIAVTNDFYKKHKSMYSTMLSNAHRRTKKWAWHLSHVIRKEKLEHLSQTGLIPGKRACGRQRQTYMQQFCKSPTTLIHDAHNRKVWKILLMRRSTSGPDRIQDDDSSRHRHSQLLGLRMLIGIWI